MKIVFVGGVKFSYEILKSILENGWDISVLFTYEDSKKEIYSDFSNFDDLVTKFNLYHVKVNNINDQTNFEILKNIQPDLILVMGWSQILKNEIIKIPSIGVIGSHPTELPKYRGRAPIPWSILKDLKESALTFFFISEGVDDGDIIDQKKFQINNNDDASTIYQKVSELGKEMILNNLKSLKDGTFKRIPQDNNQFVESWKKRTIEDGKIIWTHDASKILNLIRASTIPYPGAFSYLKRKKLIIWKAEILKNESETPGKIYEITANGAKIGTGNNVLLAKVISFDDEKGDANKILSEKHLGEILI